MASLNRVFMRSRRAGLPQARLFSEAVSDPSNRFQVYVSRSLDPYLNLSIEHYLLQKSTPQSVVLFLYSNRPCVVIGRNQNPWLEVNLGLLNRPGKVAKFQKQWQNNESPQAVCLVRRRSGGGTVFHDEGNVNYSVICPSADFSRDKHAEMVVRALVGLGATTARVNERHDIVVDDPNPKTQIPHVDDPVSRNFTCKISGSAYKLTRLRSLHHGTCLLNSPNLSMIGQFLRSPAEPFIKARGVDSVRSKIRNVWISNAEFERAVTAEFSSMYGNVDVKAITAEEAELVPQIMQGYDELKSLRWIYTQTPQFTFSTYPTAEDLRDDRPRPFYVPNVFDVNFTARHGQITQAKVTGVPAPSLESTFIHEVDDWRRLFGKQPGKWLNLLFGVRPEQGEKIYRVRYNRDDF